ncbi:MAG: recombinase family protein, partial [Oscillospiraceae bacterium]|nr:recombinase family protein [Oscillospiraceae bacterium]
VPPYGYDKIKTGKSYTLVENSESDVVRLIFDLFVNQNMGFAKICQYLDSMGIKPRKKDYWVQASIKTILQNPVYTGKIRWNFRKTIKTYENGKIIKHRPQAQEDTWILVDGKHTALISEELFSLAIEKFGKIPRTKIKIELINPFAGLCRCECGCAMVTKPFQKAQLRIMCQQQTHCHNKSALYVEFEQEVIKQLQIHIQETESMFKQQKENQAELLQLETVEKLKKELLELEIQQDKLYDLLERGIYTETIFVKRNALLAEQRKKLQQTIQHAEQNQKIQIDYQNRLLKFSEAISCIQNQTISPKEKNDFLKTVISKIIYTRKMPRSDKSPFILTISFCI